MKAQVLARADAVLRGQNGAAVLPLVGIVAVFGASYGAVMGAFSTLNDGRVLLPIVYSALKVPLLLLLTCALSVPSFFVLNTLLGVRDDFGRVARALVASQACLTLVLASLAPFTLFWYVSGASYHAAILFNAAMFGVASAGAQARLRRLYRPLIAGNPAHQTLLRLWLVVFAFVGVQMGWMLRPFVGDPARPTGFLRDDTWGNAYLIVGRLIWDVLSGGR